jgi:UDP-N-acetylglucosamine 2-epimerase (non-hydrolysing)
MKLGSVDFKNIQLIDPQNYFSFIDLMKNSKFIISDSGGVQEEAAILRKPLIIPREYTERPEMLGKFNLLANNVNDLYIECEKVINNSSNLCTSVLESDLLYGEEEPVDKIIEYII